MRFKTDIRQFYNQENGIDDYLRLLLEKERKKLSRVKRYLFVEESNVSKNDLESIIIEAKKIMGVDYLVCTVDLASMLTDFGVKPGEIEMSMNEIHIMGRKLNVHFILVFQANREVISEKIRKYEDLDKLRPTLKNIKNSGAIAERSRCVLGLFRKKHYLAQYFPEDPRLEIEDDIMDVQIMKQNGGSLGLLKYLFYPEWSYFFPYKEDKIRERVITNKE